MKVKILLLWEGAEANMALGKTDIKHLENNMINIYGLNSQNKDCWNTFQYVTRSLEEWATETTIGSQMKENSQKLSILLEQTIDNIDKLVNRINEFNRIQKEYNRG